MRRSSKICSTLRTLTATVRYRHCGVVWHTPVYGATVEARTRHHACVCGATVKGRTRHHACVCGHGCWNRGHAITCVSVVPRDYHTITRCVFLVKRSLLTRPSPCVRPPQSCDSSHLIRVSKSQHVRILPSIHPSSLTPRVSCSLFVSVFVTGTVTYDTAFFSPGKVDDGEFETMMLRTNLFRSNELE